MTALEDASQAFPGKAGVFRSQALRRRGSRPAAAPEACGGKRLAPAPQNDVSKPSTCEQIKMRNSF